MRRRETDRSKARFATRTALLAAALVSALLGSTGSALAAPTPTHPYLPALTQSGFTEPCGDAVDTHGDLYVADFEGTVIKVFGPAGEALTQFTPEEPICSLAVDSTGALYAAGFETKATKYVPTGGAFPPTASTTYEVDATAGTNGILTEERVSSVSVDPADDHVYIVEERGRVGVYDSAGARIETLAEGLVPGAEYIGVDVYGANGEIYLSDGATGHEAVYVLNPAGNQILAEIDGADSPTGRFTGFSYAYMAVDQTDGNVFVNDIPGAGVVDEYNAAGHFVSQIGPTFGGGETLTDAAPTDIAVDNGASSPNQGDVYVTSGNGKVYAFGPLPTPTHPYLPALTQGGLAEPCGDAVDSHGDLYVADYEADVIKVFGPAGEALTQFTPDEPICSLAVDSTGAIYAAGFEAKATKYVPEGGQYPPTSTTGYEVDTAAGTNGVLTEERVSSVSVDPSDDHVYVVEERARVGVYDSTGARLETLAENLVPGAEYAGVDVYGANGEVYLSDGATGYEAVYILNPAGNQILAEIDGADSPTGRFTGLSYAYLAVDQTDGNVFVNNIPGAGVVDEFNAAGHFVSQVGPTFGGGETFTDSAPSDVAVDNGASSPNQGDLYVTSYNGKVYAFGPSSHGAERPEARTEGATEITPTSALLHATVNPNGAATIRCEFEWGLAAGSYTSGSAACSPDPGSSATAVDVSAEAQGLSPDETYHYQVVIETAGGITEGGDRVLTREPPSVSVPSATSGATTDGADALLQGTVNPHFSQTTYQFEYVTDQAYAESEFADATRAPASSASIGGGGTFVPVSQAVSGLQASTTYHLRFAANNQIGSGTSPERTFTTPPLGSGLPNGRAFELVSPADKRPVGYVSYLLPNQLPFQAAASGEKVYYPINNGLEDATAGGLVRYIARRGATEWSSTQVTPPSLVPPLRPGSVYTGLYRWYSPELNCGLVESIEPLTADTPAADTENGVSNLYVRNEDGSYTLVSAEEPLNPSFETGGGYYFQVAGATADCSHVLFETPYRLLPQAPAAGVGLYEWSNGTLRLAAIRPDGSVAPEARTGSEGNANAVTPDGSVVFTATSTETAEVGRRAVFIREDGVRTVNASKSKTGVANRGANFQIASADGTQVFFTANYGLATNGSSTGPGSCNGATEESGEGCDLYEFEVETGHLTDLSADSNPSDPEGAGVVGVVGISDNGSYVYFAARGQLLAGAGRTYEQNTDGEGSYNVYLAHSGHISFVGLIKANESNSAAFVGQSSERTSHVTPDGKHLLFTSALNITGYENGGAQEVYVYTADSNSTTCVSCRSDGLPSVQPVLVPPIKQKSISGNEDYIPRSLSDNGSRVFFTSQDPLAAGSVAGYQNIYEWEDGSVHLLVTGHVDLDKGEVPSEYIDSSASGDDVFIATKEQLAPQDTDFTTDLYDIRIDGGFPYTPPPSRCEPLAEQCQGPPAGQPAAINPASEAAVGPGNPRFPKPKTKCPQGKRRVTKQGKSRCVKRQARHKPRKSHHRRTARHADNHRRPAR